jgi:hypothetical protein
MCQEEYNPELVLAIEGDKVFIEIALDIMEMTSIEGGKSSVLKYIDNLGGFDFSHICTDIEGNLRLFIGLQCPWCFDTFDICGFYALELERGARRDIYLNEFERVYKFKPKSYLNSVLSLLVFEILKTYLGKITKSYMEKLLEEEQEFYDLDGDELPSIGKLPGDYDIETDISSAFEELNKKNDENLIDPDDLCMN